MSEPRLKVARRTQQDLRTLPARHRRSPVSRERFVADVAHLDDTHSLVRH